MASAQRAIAWAHRAASSTSPPNARPPSPLARSSSRPAATIASRANFDLGGPVVGNEQFSYRLTGLVRDAKDWLPGGKDNRTYIAPAITWQPDADTSVTVLAEHLIANITANSAYFSDAATCRLTNTFNMDPAYSTASIEQYVDAVTDHEGVAEPENSVAVGGLKRGAIAGRLSLGRVDCVEGDLVL